MYDEHLHLHLGLFMVISTNTLENLAFTRLRSGQNVFLLVNVTEEEILLRVSYCIINAGVAHARRTKKTVMTPPTMAGPPKSHMR